MASSITNTINNRIRLSGLGSGLDTDSIISDMLKVDNLKIDKVKQDRTLLEWKRDDYRSITNAIRGFRDNFFDYLKPTSNMRSKTIYQKYTSAYSDSSIATAVGGEGVTSLKHSIKVTKLATASEATSSGEITSKDVTGAAISNVSVNSTENTFNINYNGVSRLITLPSGNYADASAIVGNGSDGKLAQLVNQAFNGNVTASVSAGGGIKLSPANATDTVTISTYDRAQDDLLSKLGVDDEGKSTDAITFPLTINKGRAFNIYTVENRVSSVKTISWENDNTFNNITDLKNTLNAKLQLAGLDGKISADIEEGKLVFKKDVSVAEFSLGDTLKNDNIVGYLGFDSGDSNKLNGSMTMGKVASMLGGGGIIFNADDTFDLTINGSTIKVGRNDTFNSFINKVNSSTAGVNITYSAYSNKFTLTDIDTGKGTLVLNDNGSNFFSSTLLAGTVVDGVDAEFLIDGKFGSRSTNSFSADGVQYTLLKADPDKTIDITLTQDVDSTFNAIKSFVEKYNEIIGTITTKISEARDRDYLPLTDEQKEAMTEEDIKKWEAKAKTGILKNDSVLNDIYQKMRSALYTTISGSGGNLTTIGITTGSFKEKGKLVIDETKLRNAIKNTPTVVMNVFAKESNISYSPDLNEHDKSTRNQETGIVNRLYDIIQDSIRTTRNNKGHKGALLEKAGITDDISEYKNIISDEIGGKDKLIDNLTQKMYDKQERLYKKFQAMETALGRMNSQSSWISQQFGGGSS